MRDRAAPRAEIPRQLDIMCYRCGHLCTHNSPAESGSCPRCAGRLEYHDRTIETGHWGTSIQTTGSVTIGAQAQVTANLIVCSGDLHIFGQVHAMCICGGRASVGSDAHLRGGVRCASLHLADGAMIDGCLIETRSKAIGIIDIEQAMRSAPGKGAASEIGIKPQVRTIEQSETIAARLYPGKHGAKQAVITPRPDDTGNTAKRAVS